MLSNYPPGVTGNEPEIAGPLSESTDRSLMECDECGLLDYVDVSVTRWTRDEAQLDWDCPRCRQHHTSEFIIEPDYPEEYL